MSKNAHYVDPARPARNAGLSRHRPRKPLFQFVLTAEEAYDARWLLSHGGTGTVRVSA